MSATVWTPVMRRRSSFGPHVTFTLHPLARPLCQRPGPQRHRVQPRGDVQALSPQQFATATSARVPQMVSWRH